MSNKEIPYLSDMISIMRDEINEIGLDGSLNELTDDRVLPTYFTLCRRLISQKPRQVFKAKNFSCPSSLTSGLTILEEKIRQGEDVNPYQSRGLADVNNKDGMLFDWGIHHFHLGEEEAENKKNFIKRTGDILYAMVKDNAFYFIVIAPHKNWSNIELLLETIEDNWPELIESWQIKDANLVYNPTNEEVAGLRKSGVNCSIQLKSGNVYLGPGGGIATDGSMALASLDYTRTVHILRELKKEIDNNYPNREFRITRKDSDTLAIIDKVTGKVPYISQMPTLKKCFGSFIV